MSRKLITFPQPGVYNITLPEGVEAYAKVRLWGGGGGAGANHNGQAGGSGAAGAHVRTNLFYLRKFVTMKIVVGAGGGQSGQFQGLALGGKSLYEEGGVKASGGAGGWQGHKNSASQIGKGGAGGGASIVMLNNLVIGAAGGGGGGGGASAGNAGGHATTEPGDYAFGPGQQGQEMIGNGAGGGGGGGGANSGRGGHFGADNASGGGGGSSGGYTLSATGGGFADYGKGRTPVRFDDGTFKYGQGGLTNYENGANGYAEIEFTIGKIGHVKRSGEWQEIVTAHQKINGDWKKVQSAYLKTQGDHYATGSWNIVNNYGEEPDLTFAPNAGEFGHDQANAQYVDPPPPPPPPPQRQQDDENWTEQDDHDAGVGEGGGGGDSIICTALHRLGYLPHHIYQADQKFGEFMKLHDPAVYKGYLKWAEHVVGWLENKDDSNIMPWIKDDKIRIKKTKQWALNWTLPIATPWTTEMAYQMGYVDKGSYVGKLLMLIGKPICRYLANNNRKVEKKHLIILLAVLGIARFISMFSLTNYNVQSHRRSIDDIRRI